MQEEEFSELLQEESEPELVVLLPKPVRGGGEEIAETRLTFPQSAFHLFSLIDFAL